MNITQCCQCAEAIIVGGIHFCPKDLPSAHLMTLRDHFAGLALQTIFQQGIRDGCNEMELCKEAYGIADSMMKARGP